MRAMGVARVVVIGAALALLPNLVRAQQAVRIGFGAATLSFLPIWSARALDTFKPQGLSANVVVLPGGDPSALAALDAGTHFFLIDAPADAYKPLATAVKGRDALLFNVSEPDDSLRRDVCAAEIVHVYPSRAQLADGLVQYIVSRKWRDLLVLQGPAAEDATMTTAFEHSAQKFGARIVAKQHFKPGTDPREREANDPALLSAEPKMCL